MVSDPRQSSVTIREIAGASWMALTVTEVRNLRTPGKYLDGPGLVLHQGCSMHSTEAPVGQGLESSESGGVSGLTEGAGSVTAQHIVGEAA